MRVHIIDGKIEECWLADGRCGFEYKHIYSMREAQQALAVIEIERAASQERARQRSPLTREEFLRLVNMFHELDESEFDELPVDIDNY